MPAEIILEPTSALVTTNTEEENDFELDVRIDTATPKNTELSTPFGCTVNHTCASCAGQASCAHSCASVWYVWCCN